MHLILDTYGASIEREDARFKITSGEQERMIAPSRISSFNLIKNATISSAAILLAVEHDIPIIIYNRQGKPAARMWSSYSGSIATIRRNQVKLAEHPDGITFLLHVYRTKTMEQCRNLSRLAERRPARREVMELAEQRMKAKLEATAADGADPKMELMNLDAITSRYYWEALSEAMKEDMPFEKRSRQPAADAFNALINYMYGMLYSVVEGAVISAGLDPQLGLLHVDEYNEPTFVFDCIEPFRPWTDWLVLELILGKKLNTTCFEAEEKGVWISREGKKVIIPAFFEYMKTATLFNGRRIKREDQIRYFCTQLAGRLKSFQAETIDRQSWDEHSTI